MKKLEEVNQEISRKQRLIIQHNQRLQVLKERKAQFGIDTPPHIVTEIEQIEQELEKLQAELEQLEQEKQLLEAPLVQLHTFGALDRNLPEGINLIDWSDEFDRSVTPRKIPGPAVWKNKLWVDLKDLEKKLGQATVIRLQGKIALSAGFAFGCVFSRVSQYQLQVAQTPPDPPQLWRSHAALDEMEPIFAQQEIAGQPNAREIGVVVNALPGQNSDDLLAEVNSYLGTHGGLKKILLLEAEIATRQGKFVKGWEAAVLARTSQPGLRTFVKRNPADTLHVFLATPAGLAVFLGHQWNAIGISAQLHEWAGLTAQYLPSCVVLLN